MSFVSVLKADINNFENFIFGKVYTGVTAATKSGFQKKKKVKSGVRIVKKCWNFLLKSSFYSFFFTLGGPPFCLLAERLHGSDRLFFGLLFFPFIAGDIFHKSD